MNVHITFILSVKRHYYFKNQITVSVCSHDLLILFFPLDLLNADLSLNLGDITERMNALQTTGNNSNNGSYRGVGAEETTAMSQCAFPELRYISLAYNRVRDTSSSYYTPQLKIPNRRKEGNVLFNDALNTFLFTVIWRQTR